MQFMWWSGTMRGLFRLALVVFILPLPLHAGVFTEEEQSISGIQGMAPQVVKVRSWYQGDLVKQAYVERDQVLIVDYRQRLLTMMQPSRSIYWRTPIHGYEAFMRQALEQWGVSRLADGTVAAPDDLYQRTGKTKKIGKWQAYEVVTRLPAGVPGKVTMWFSEQTGLDIKDLQATLKMALMVDEGQDFAAFFSQLTRLKGYPVLMVAETEAGGRRMTLSKRLLNARKGRFPASEFAVPDSYTEQPSPLAPQQPAAGPRSGASATRPGGSSSKQQ